MGSLTKRLIVERRAQSRTNNGKIPPSELGFYKHILLLKLTHSCSSFSVFTSLQRGRHPSPDFLLGLTPEFQLMAKKNSSKTPSKAAEKEVEDTVMEQKKQSSTPKKAGNEIDEIFAGKKRKKPEEKKSEKSNGDEISKSKSMKKKKKKSKEGKEEGRKEPRSSGSRKKTGDGFAIYTEEELGINKADAGNTPLCPFDCDCCF
ncbi:hypothetical protein CCACVL1_01613 [Corchorus capsularis]|uniref:DUF1764 domain-containing protein n=1 Tax=Corchorus capsularis TaxID=210143 RepID=A0A1R3KH45_COCAP|nr:hypothetical protein CCACVL1_01613 [Corchorus capsularis]